MPPDQWLEAARQIKEAHCYTCSDASKVPRPRPKPQRMLTRRWWEAPRPPKSMSAGTVIAHVQLATERRTLMELYGRAGAGKV